jgi:SPX domain protein involved in polyphosphate accumulation
VTRAATDLFRTLHYLRNFCILNYTGLLKAAKKFDKKVSPSELLLTDSKAEMDELSFVQNQEIDILSNKLVSAFAWAFCEGSLQVAHSTLLLRKERPAARPLLSLGMRLGFAFSLLMWIAW